jgi:hypothetical protein
MNRCRALNNANTIRHVPTVGQVQVSPAGLGPFMAVAAKISSLSLRGFFNCKICSGVLQELCYLCPTGAAHVMRMLHRLRRSSNTGWSPKALHNKISPCHPLTGQLRPVEQNQACRCPHTAVLVQLQPGSQLQVCNHILQELCLLSATGAAHVVRMPIMLQKYQEMGTGPESPTR